MSIDTIDDPASGIGHNSGSEAFDLIERTLRRSDEIERGAAGYLLVENSDLMRRLREIEKTIALGLPEKIDSKSEAEKLSDVQFAIKKWITAAKSSRTAAKRPWDSIAKAVYAFFTRPIEDLEAVAEKRIGPVLLDWQDREASRIKREEAERARILREEQERKEREAREAEERKLEAERREREAKEAAERADREREANLKAAAEAKRQREEEDRKAAEAREKAKREEAERKLKAQAEEAEKVARDQAEAEARAVREAERKAEEEAAKARRDELMREEAEHKAAAAKALAERREHEKAAAAAKKEIRAETRNETEAAEAATRAERKADKSEQIAEAKPAELTRVRGEAGSVSTLRTYFNFRALSRAELDLEALRQHIPADALETAVRSFIAAGGRQLRGVEIFEDAQSITR